MKAGFMTYRGHSLKWLLIIVALTPILFADDWPQWRGLNRDGSWHEKGIVQKFEKSQIPVLWRTPISRGYSGPTVSQNRVYVMDRIKDPNQLERVLCFNAKTGKEIWSHSYPCQYKIG